MPGLKLNLPRIISRNFNFCFFISLLPPALLSPLYLASPKSIPGSSGWLHRQPTA